MFKNVRMISFTGSTKIGKQIREYAAVGDLKRLRLGLSGKSPLILLDANHDLSRFFFM